MAETAANLVGVIYPQDDKGKSYIGWVETTDGLWRSDQLTATSRTAMVTALKAEAVKIKASKSKYIPEKIDL